jgi:hypothetical protein
MDIDTGNIEAVDPLLDSGDENNPGRAFANGFAWFVLLAITTFGIVIISNKGIRDKLLGKMQGLTSRLRRKPVMTEED